MHFRRAFSTTPDAVPTAAPAANPSPAIPILLSGPKYPRLVATVVAPNALNAVTLCSHYCFCIPNVTQELDLAQAKSNS